MGRPARQLVSVGWIASRQLAIGRQHAGECPRQEGHLVVSYHMYRLGAIRQAGLRTARQLAAAACRAIADHAGASE